MNPKLVNILPVFLLAAELGNVADSMGRTKGVSKYLKLTDIFDELMGIGNVDFKAILPGFKSLEQSDRAELVQEIGKKLSLKDAKVEAAIEEGLGIIIDAVSLVERAKKMVASLKDEAPAPTVNEPAKA
jgi:plasmid replication initiation protein